MKIYKTINMLFLLLLALAQFSNACLITRRYADQSWLPLQGNPETKGPFMLRNFDFPVGGDYDGFGELVVNPRNYQRMSLRYFHDDNPVNWTSTYGSVTFNLIGESFPQGGMNEKGLAMEITVLNNMYWPNLAVDNRPTVTEMDIVQYILDQASTIHEAKALLFDTSFITGVLTQRLRLTILTEIVDKNHGQVLNYHWGLCDASGRCALIEYVNDKFTWKEYSKDDMFIVTNNDDGALRSEWERLNQKTLPLPQYIVSRTSLSRYANARWFAEHPPEELGSEDFNVVKDNLFHQLDRSTTNKWNKWQTVFNIGNRTIYYQTRPSLNRKTIHLNDLDFDLPQPVSKSLHSGYHTQVLEQNDFSIPDLSKISVDFHRVSSILRQPIEWSEHVIDLINETRAVNNDEADWQFISFEHVDEIPGELAVIWNECLIALRYVWRQLTGWAIGY